MTDTRGQTDSDALSLTFDRLMLAMRTALPGTVQSFDAANQTVTVVPAIRRVVTLDGEQTTLNMPKVLEVPLVFPHAQTAGYSLTMPIQKGDEVLLVVADRSIDNWAQSGGSQNPVEPTQPRHHDISDCLAVIGATPKAKRVTDYKTDRAELRDKTRENRVSIKEGEAQVFATEQVNLGGPNGAPVARLGDMVHIGSGSSAGYWPIVTSAIKTRAE